MPRTDGSRCEISPFLFQGRLSFSAVQCGAVLCGVVRCDAVQCGVVRCGGVHYSAPLLPGVLVWPEGRVLLPNSSNRSPLAGGSNKSIALFL